MDELRARIAQETNPFFHLFRDWAVKKSPRIPPPSYGYVIAFPNKGLHSIEYPRNSGNNCVLAFENKSDCEAFGKLLRAQKFFDPQPQRVDFSELQAFCDRLGVYSQVVPDGVQLIPPKKRVLKMGINSDIKDQRNFLNAMYYEELEVEDIGVIERGAVGTFE